ncbi:unnamed protein product [Rotaria magnacalcarata]|uniref:Uncharacterized protein n=1 Tax=Rotaria magnacalcarata TaxID=392030 RepID=A0A816S8X8_9BILA|nr:unnamed protein product [Rotaria magnacalcarata]CAF1634069.1 unnamed protein product [Rotaria magnacalcarata]CAF2078694.1 unnamed protein product [Rotaria magnacalcarata]
MGALHQQLQQLILRLNQQPVKSDRQLQGTLSNNTLTAELHEVKKKNQLMIFPSRLIRRRILSDPITSY